MKTFKFPLVLRTRENTDVFITLDDNIYGIHSKRVNILYVSTSMQRHGIASTLMQRCINVMCPLGKLAERQMKAKMAISRWRIQID